MAKTEKDWMAEGDAHTLAEAVAIQGDPGRRTAAQGAAKGLVKDEKKRQKETQARTVAMSRVAKNTYSEEFTKKHGRKKK